MGRWLVLGVCILGLVGSGCGDDDGADGLDGGQDGPPDVSMGLVEGRVFHAVSRAPLAGAQVKVGTGADEVVVTTDAQGRFTAQTPASASAVVKAEADGMEASLKQVTLAEGGADYLELFSMPVGKHEVIDADVGAEIKGPLGASIKLPPGGLVTAAGTPVTGMVDVTLTPMLPQDPRQLAARPGRAQGKRPDDSVVPMVPVVSMAATLKQGDATVTLASGVEATVKLPIPDPATPKRVVLWGLDESTGEWVEEGAVSKVDTPSGAVYKGQVSHFSFWSLEMPAEATGCLRGCVSGATGAVRVVAEGVDLPFRDEVTTDDAGCYAVDVTLGGRVRVRAVGPDGASARVTVPAPPADGSSDAPDTCGEVGTLALEPADDPDCPAGLVRCGAACVDITSEALHCGGCNASCGAGVADGTLPVGSACVDGTCGCPPSRPDVCDDRCVNLQVDTQGCGATCGDAVACVAGEECVAGACEARECPEGTVPCMDECVDIDDDVRHCGGCVGGDGVDCSSAIYAEDAGALSCEGGSCLCSPGFVECDFEGRMCLDPSTSIDACGGCDGSCSFGAEVCVAGECQDNPCEPGQLDCDGACADPATDPNHCGGCGIECETGLCEGGACACPEGLTDCYDGDPVETLCVNTDIEAGHCGSCFTNGCSACDGGDCILLTDCFDSVACGDGCAQLDSDPDHCGGCHNACDANEACVGGDCTCTEGFARCGGDACIELATSDVHCGRCDHPCGVGQRCEDSVCVY
jgi:hypothetical protein